MHEADDILVEAGVASYKTPEQAIRGFMTLVAYSRNLDALFETPKDVPVGFSIDRESMAKEIRSLIRDKEPVLSEEVSKKILETYGIATTLPQIAVTAKAAAEIAGSIGYPVVLKIHSPDITHKSDVGGVALNLGNEMQVRQAFDRVIESCRTKVPGCRIEGVSVQRMVSSNDAVEMILGIKKDNVFGTVLLAGMGGITAELFRDKALLTAPAE